MRNKATLKLLMHILILLVLLGGTVYSTPVQSEENTANLPSDKNPDIKAASAILMDTERGQVLYKKDSNTKLHISSVCKLMTVLLAVETGDLSPSVTISADSVDAEGSALGLQAGMKYVLNELLYGIMLTSGNDAAEAVAEYIGGDVDNFVVKMNETAAKLNMTNTHFTNPTGLFSQEQYTTAYDVSLLIKYAITKPAFNEIFSAQARPWEYENGDVKILTSQNKLFWSYDGIEGGKTGYIKKEQQTLAATAVRGNMNLICVILDAPENDLFDNATTLLDYGFINFRKSILAHKGDPLKSITVEGKNINLISQEDVSYIHPTGESYIKKFRADIDLQAPFKKSTLAGMAEYILNDGTQISINLYPETEIVSPVGFFLSAKNKILENKNILYLVLFLLFIEVIIIIVNIIKLFRKAASKLFSDKK